jgi:hypothetical protein
MGERTRAEAEPGRRTYLVEHYWPGVTPEAFGEAAERVRTSALELEAAGYEVRFLHSTLVPEDEAAYCVLMADSPLLVQETYAKAGVRFERLVAAVESTALSATKQPSAGPLS